MEVNTEITKRLYLASAVAPQGDCVYGVEEKPFDSAAIIRFLKVLLACFPGEKIMIIGEGASIHDSELIRAFLRDDQQAGRLHLEKQPAYAPEFNADEQVWAYLKCHGLIRKCCHSLAQLKEKVIEQMEKIKNNQPLIQNFFRHPDLGFY